MREYKFRGKRVVNGEWVYGCCIVNLIIFDGEYEYEVDPETLGQYTGLKDSKGNEIYEGDIVKVEDGKYTGVVKFNEQDLSYVIEDNTGGYGFINGQIYDEWPEYRTYEVIGNRWDNPDLLGEVVE